MSFQAYMDNIEAKTGVTPDQFVELARVKGLLESTTKATDVVNWLKADYYLGHGHAMAIVQYFKIKGVWH